MGLSRSSRLSPVDAVNPVRDRRSSKRQSRHKSDMSGGAAGNSPAGSYTVQRTTSSHKVYAYSSSKRTSEQR